MPQYCSGSDPLGWVPGCSCGLPSSGCCHTAMQYTERMSGYSETLLSLSVFCFICDLQGGLGCCLVVGSLSNMHETLGLRPGTKKPNIIIVTIININAYTKTTPSHNFRLLGRHCIEASVSHTPHTCSTELGPVLLSELCKSLFHCRTAPGAGVEPFTGGDPSGPSYLRLCRAGAGEN